MLDRALGVLEARFDVTRGPGEVAHQVRGSGEPEVVVKLPKRGCGCLGDGDRRVDVDRLRMAIEAQALALHRRPPADEREAQALAELDGPLRHVGRLAEGSGLRKGRSERRQELGSGGLAGPE